MTKRFHLKSTFQPCGDQPQAIETLVQYIKSGIPHMTLLGVTGSGKTFTMAKIIEKTQRPTLVIAHNKTLAAQLYREFKYFFPENAVHYFVSYYDYYQPEAYIPTTDTYIEKDTSINDELDKMRHAATRALLERDDVLIVASVSCIYGLGAPIDYSHLIFKLEEGQCISRRNVLEKLVELQYSRQDMVLTRGTFRVRGDTVEIFGIGDDYACRVEFFGDVIDRLTHIDPLRGIKLRHADRIVIFPASHYVTQREKWPDILSAIRAELALRCDFLDEAGKLLEKQRLIQRTEFDLEMMELTGTCTGIENYSRHLTGRSPGTPPPTLLDYFPENSLVFIDESHVTIPQLKAMYRGDRSRKETLVQYGFRLPSALDNRPLTFDEFMKKIHTVIYVSATPGPFEQKLSKTHIVEQLIRPTGLLDPIICVRPAKGQVDDLFDEIKIRSEKGERVLVTTLTKKMAESLTEYYKEMGLKVEYLHSDVDTLERIRIIRQLRRGDFDALIGINLLREGLDIPEVSLVAILDADREGFLRSTTSLIQTIGRCARHSAGMAVLYADTITPSMETAIRETKRRRKIQDTYNKIHAITPQTIQKTIDREAFVIASMDYVAVPHTEAKTPDQWTTEELEKTILEKEEYMRHLARMLKFEEAAEIRDQVLELRKYL